MPILKKYILNKIKKREEEKLQESIDSQELKNLKDINKKLREISPHDIENNTSQNDKSIKFEEFRKFRKSEK